jgi:hypothetical protein
MGAIGYYQKITRERAIAIVQKMGQLQAMGSTRTDPFWYETEAVSLLSNAEVNEALRVGYAKIRGF